MIYDKYDKILTSRMILHTIYQYKSVAFLFSFIILGGAIFFLPFLLFPLLSFHIPVPARAATFTDNLEYRPLDSPKLFNSPPSVPVSIPYPLSEFAYFPPPTSALFPIIAAPFLDTMLLLIFPKLFR